MVALAAGQAHAGSAQSLSSPNNRLATCSGWQSQPTDKSTVVVLAEFCQRNYIRSLSLFGSAAKGELAPESDVDVLVEFEPGHVPGLALIRMQDELSVIRADARLNL